MSTIKIRTAAFEDLGTVFNLASQLSESVHINKKVLERNFEKLLNDENHLVLVAENKNVVVGYLSAHIHTTIYANGNTAYIDQIVVSHNKRGTGIGKKLMSEIERTAKSNRCVLGGLGDLKSEYVLRRTGICFYIILLQEISGIEESMLGKPVRKIVLYVYCCKTNIKSNLLT